MLRVGVAIPEGCHHELCRWGAFTPILVTQAVSVEFCNKTEEIDLWMWSRLYDADGDRFNTRINTKPFLAEVLPANDGWRLVSIPLGSSQNLPGIPAGMESWTGVK